MRFLEGLARSENAQCLYCRGTLCQVPGRTGRLGTHPLQMPALQQGTTPSTASGEGRNYASLCETTWLTFCATGTGDTYPRTGPGRHSSDPQHRRCGVGYYTDTQERVWLPLPGLKQSVYRAEFLVCALSCQGFASFANRQTPPERTQPWIKAHLKQTAVDSGRITADDFQGSQQADVLANQGTAQHGRLEPDATWLTWADFANEVCHFWRQVGPQLRERPEAEPRARLQAEPAVKPPAAQQSAQPLSGAPFQLGAHQRVVKHEAFLQCLDCNRLPICVLKTAGSLR
eukprot:5037781-Amphidinium_carterae.4